jgi:hypothetical protein
MDLTLEIFGWVKSLEDALTQFTTPEELDGENMYRCGRLDNLFPFPFLSFPFFFSFPFLFYFVCDHYHGMY